VLFPEVPEHHLRFRLEETAHHFAFSDHIDVHLLELPKFTKAATELLTGLDIWLYFLRHAQNMDLEALPAALERPLVRRALEELKMLSQTDLEREQYEARRKAQLDHNTALKVAQIEREGAREEGRREGREEGRRQGRQEGRQEGREEGRQEGRTEGEKIGMIRLLERLLHRPQTPTEQLCSMSLEELARLADALQEAYQKQR
jgi:predicted transposase/invertase (TIGR01784 family)